MNSETGIWSPWMVEILLTLLSSRHPRETYKGNAGLETGYDGIMGGYHAGRAMPSG